jgi:hypothetical protein
VNIEKKQLEWQKTQFVLDKLLNPITFLVGGFVATNILQNTPVSGLSKKTGRDTFNTATAEVNYLTPDQANVLRAGIVAVASSQTGILDSVSSVVKGLIGAAK